MLSDPSHLHAVDEVGMLIESGSIAPDESNLTWINDPRTIIYLRNESGLPKSTNWSASLSPPPCAGAAPQVEVVVDGKRTAVTIDHPTRTAVDVELGPYETKLVTIDDLSPVCRLSTGDDRPFYFGLSDMRLLAVASRNG